MKNRVLCLFLAAALAVSVQAPLFSQVDADSVYGLGLDDLLSINLDVAQGRFTSREAPNIVSVVTEAEIVQSGARDLIDVLRLVPGFEFGVDVNGTVDIGFRGNWAHEGKILVLLDGQAMNENVYGTNEFGFHYPVDQIKQIEIIRGPGSVMYGGWAELAVINIKTKDAKDIDGLSSTLTYGQMTAARGRESGSFSFGKSIQDLDVVAHVFTGFANRSDQDYTSFGGTTFNFKDKETITPYMVNVGMKYKGLDVRVINDEYRNMQQDWWGPALSHPLKNNFDTYILDAKYDYKASDALTLTGRFTRKEGTAYYRAGNGADSILVEGSAVPKDVRFETYYWRNTEELSASYDISKKVNLLGGLQVYNETGEYLNRTVNPLLGNGYYLYFSNVALYAQATADSPAGNIIVGGRYEKHSQVPAAFVPRLALTKAFDRFHYKVLYAQAFKTPAIDNINLNPEIKPEKAEIAEVEAGYKLTGDMLLTVNAFNILINDTIIYYADDFIETQLNAGKTGTRGIELECKYMKDWGFVNLGYSFNQANGNEVAIYTVPGKDDILLGLPANKLSLNALYKIGKFGIDPSVVYFTERYGFARSGQSVQKYDPVLLANLFLTYTPVNNLRIGVGVYDMLDQKPVFIQPYNGGHSPIPGPSREYLAKLTYDLKF